jgi:hypothetical protein
MWTPPIYCSIPPLRSSLPSRNPCQLGTNGGDARARGTPAERAARRRGRRCDRCARAPPPPRRALGTSDRHRAARRRVRRGRHRTGSTQRPAATRHMDRARCGRGPGPRRAPRPPQRHVPRGDRHRTRQRHADRGSRRLTGRREQAGRRSPWAPSDVLEAGPRSTLWMAFAGPAGLARAGARVAPACSFSGSTVRGCRCCRSANLGA